MPVYYKEKSVDIGMIQPDGEQPDWVKKAFEINAFAWMDQHLRVCMPILYPKWVDDARNTPKWVDDARNTGYNMYRRAEIGDIIDRTNGRIITPKTFEKEYRVEKR